MNNTMTPSGRAVAATLLALAVIGAGTTAAEAKANQRRHQQALLRRCHLLTNPAIT